MKPLTFELINVLKKMLLLYKYEHTIFLMGKKYCVQGIHRLKSFVPKISSL